MKKIANSFSELKRIDTLKLWCFGKEYLGSNEKRVK